MEVDTAAPCRSDRTGSAISGFTNMSPEDYRNIFWSQLKDAIDQMLTHPPGSYKPISYEQVRLVLLSLSPPLTFLFRCTLLCISVCASSSVNSCMRIS